MLGYLGRIEGLGHVNLGVQKARYTGRQRDGRTGLVTTSKDAPWLYNAVLTFDASATTSIYVGTERGLEDSGVAPESAANRAEQLPATHTRQVEAGVKWKIGKLQAAVSAFEITKAYFSYDAQRSFVRLGSVRHRGIEGSLSGKLGKRLSVVAGAVVMQPRVSGPGVDSGVLGRRPTGTAGVHGKLDANYRTDLLGGLTGTMAVNYLSSRAVTSGPVIGGTRQLLLPAVTTLDLGLRKQFNIGRTPASLRAVALNLFDAKAWKVAAANTLYPDERRRFTLTLAADF
jgi:iron complex outermembrane receptor protein